jgi:uncharacterized repeat protein (TIGR01451 family)
MPLARHFRASRSGHGSGSARPRTSLIRLLVYAAALLIGLAIPAPRAAAASSWTIVPSPNVSGANSVLESVSCVSASFCVAAGIQYVPNSNTQTLIESWNGSAWSIATSQNQSTMQDNDLSGVSCVSTMFCVAAGDYNNGTNYQTLIEQWNGSVWSIVSSPNVASSGDNYFSDVRCVATNNCFAVGVYVNGSSINQTLIESWDGTAWNIVPSPNTSATQSNELSSLSCASANACMAVGQYLNGTIAQTLTEFWNGMSWNFVASPNASGSAGDLLVGVSCLSSTFCMATGGGTTGGISQSLIESWNGTSWSILPSPSPGSTLNDLNGVFCLSNIACTAVGESHSGTTYQTLVESWDGAAWTAVQSADVPNLRNFLFSISCVGALFCDTVGQVTGAAPVTTLIETQAPPPASLSIVKSHIGSFSQGNLGGYNITVSNSASGGPTTGTVTVTDTAPKGMTITAMAGTGWSCSVLPACSRSDSLAAGASYPPINVTVRVANNTPTGTNALTNSASVTGGGDPAGPHNASDPTNITGLGQPAGNANLTITKTHGGNVAQGGALIYTVTVANASAAAGPTTGTVTVTDDVPAGLTIATMSGGGWNCAVSPACTRSDALTPGTPYPAISVGVRVAANAPTGIVTNSASVSGGGDPAGPHTASDPTTITGMNPPPGAASLTITKSHSGSFTRGLSGSYTITVGNAVGAAATSGTATVVDNAPAGMTITAMSGSGWGCADLAACTRSDSLAAGGNYPALTVTVSVSLNATEGTNALTNHASVSGGGDPTGPHETADPTTIQ